MDIVMNSCALKGYKMLVCHFVNTQPFYEILKRTKKKKQKQNVAKQNAVINLDGDI